MHIVLVLLAEKSLLDVYNHGKQGTFEIVDPGCPFSSTIVSSHPKGRHRLLCRGSINSLVTISLQLVKQFVLYLSDGLELSENFQNWKVSSSACI